MAAIDLHTLDISEPLARLFSEGRRIPGAVLSLVPQTPQINVGSTTVITLGGRAKGALVHEGGRKPDNGRQPVPRTFTTAKLVYSQRVTDEFLRWADEKQGDFIGRIINDWTTKSLPRDIDTVVLHGMDPFTGTLDEELSDYVTKPGSSILIPSTGDTSAAIDTDFGSTAAALRANAIDINGIAIAGEAASKLSDVTLGNTKKYTGLGVFGLEGDNLSGIRAASTPEVGANNVKLVMGDWSQLLLGFAGQASWRVHVAGDPDGTGVDLANVNQVCIRFETHFGFRVLDPLALAYVGTAASA